MPSRTLWFASVLFIATVASPVNAADGAQVDDGIGDPTLEKYPEVSIRGSEHRQLTSAVNGQLYQVYVKPPRGYETGNKRYSVLYVLDAETNFGATSYIVQRLIKDDLIPETLVVGIAYGATYEAFYQLRGRDLTPAPGRRGEYGSAKEFQRFIETELFPFISKNYRVVDGIGRSTDTPWVASSASTHC